MSLPFLGSKKIVSVMIERGSSKPSLSSVNEAGAKDVPDALKAIASDMLHAYQTNSPLMLAKALLDFENRDKTLDQEEDQDLDSDAD